MDRKDIKMVVWVGSSLEDLRSFPDAVKDEIGYKWEMKLKKAQAMYSKI